MTQDQYLDELARIIATNFTPGAGGGMTAAHIGFLALRTLKISATAAGFANLKDALLALEKRGVLRTGLNPKGGLAIWLFGADSVSPPQGCAAPAPTDARYGSAGGGFQFLNRKLRNEVWLAFVARAPVGIRSLNRNSGEVRLGQAQRPTPPEDWVEITPVDALSDRADGLTFLRSEGLDQDSALLAAVDSPALYREFPLALQHKEPTLTAKWKHRRSQRVIAQVEQWRLSNGLRAELIYSPLPPARPNRLAEPPADTADRLRDALLAAVRRLSKDELLELRLPAKHLVATLRPELLG